MAATPGAPQARCYACGYALAGLRLGCACPECGTTAAGYPSPRPRLLSSITGRSLALVVFFAVLGLFVGFLSFLLGHKQDSTATVVGESLINWSAVLLLTSYVAAGFWAALIPARRRPSLVWLMWTGIILLIGGILMPAKGYA
jgi:hypothetical protein